jgi:hypothetical protein
MLMGIFTLDDALVLMGECVGDLSQLVEREMKRERRSRPIRSSAAKRG